MISPVIEVRRKRPDSEIRDDVMVPIYDEYIKLMKILERDTDGIKKYREDLLGTADKMIYPDVYSELSAANKRNIAWGDWKAMKLRDKAFMIANDAVANMIEIVQKNSSMTRQRYAKHNKPPAAKGKK